MKLKTGIAFIDRQPRKIGQRLKIARYYLKNPPRDKELARAVRYAVWIKPVMFPYPSKQGGRRKVEVHLDPANGYRYVMHEDKRLYFPQGQNEKSIRKAYTGLLREQDARSPHRYLTPEFDVGPQTQLFDIGAAEGILALSVVDRVAAVHLFEAEEKWIEPLKLTFAPWKEKAHIVRKYVSDVDDEQNITLDTYTEGLQAEDVLLKLDVEGAEAKVLAGGRKLLARPGTRAVICTYHRAGDFEELSASMRERGFDVVPSPGYMLFLYDPELRAPWFRRGVIHCSR